jgi:cytochrome c-type biogenesis protein CcmF
VDKNVSHPGYHAEEGDIAIQGIFDIVDNQTNRRHTIRPLFFIRDGRALNLKAYSPEDALHIRLERIDPEKEEFHLMLAQSMEQPALQVEIARDVPRNDYIVLEAIVFPGINLFWAGSCLMLIGMFLGMYKRLKKK